MRYIGILCVTLLTACSVSNPAKRADDHKAVILPKAQLQPVAPTQSKGLGYSQLLAQVKKQPINFDYPGFRLAYSASEQYKPYDFSSIAPQKFAFEAMDNSEWGQCIKHAMTILETNYTRAC